MFTSPSAPVPLQRPSILTFVTLLVVGCIVLVYINNVSQTPDQLLDGIPRVGKLLDRMMPPNLNPAFLQRIALKLLETFQIAIAGTFMGILLSLPLAWLAARDVSPISRFSFLFKAIISLFRTIPDLVCALLFVVSVGLGAVAGTLTIMVDTVGFFGRFYAEAMEDADNAPQQTLESIGASRLSILLGAVIPDASPSMVNSSLFALEKAVRSSVVLGLVGAGGIGQELKVTFDLLQYQNAVTVILAIFVIVVIMEWVTDRIRNRL